MPVAKTQDGCEIHFEVMGQSNAPAVMVGYPWCNGWARIQNAMFNGNQASLDTMLEMNRQLVGTLASKYRVVNIEYPRGSAPTTGPFEGDLKAETVAGDYLAVADAAGIQKFVAIGYSWSASFGIQVASRTPRCAGLAVGAWPVLDAPHEQLRGQVDAFARMSPAGSPAQIIMQSNANYYTSILEGWDQESALSSMAAQAGRLYLFVGSNDQGVPGMSVPIAQAIVSSRTRLEQHGWTVDVIDGHDHVSLATQQNVWLGRVMNFFENKTW
ncbi:alpha/beta fold hydrolase [Solimonas terrae]|uniref:Alpha/beta hydrolase n=1 Tax=Solimonas terrae TaxID=1396819 RepID=A0A6M2BM53_9GAMM|nr:alpha/beta hydrolase [Solimonas terrae]NGY03341.1 alpha/beta hydrolase [Solimonas terrae]